MTIFGTIYDSVTKAGIPGASISVVDPSGNSLGTGIAADNTGWFQLISPLLDQGNKIWISSVGYTSAMVDPNVFVASMGLGLDPTSDSLQAVTVTPGSSSSSKYTPYLVGGGILALLLLMGGKKKKMDTMGGLNANSETLLIGGGVVLVGGYFLVKKLLPSLNPFPSATNPLDVTATTNAQAAALAQAKASGQSTTYSADQYTGWANDIYKLGTSGSPVDQTSQSAIVNDVVNCNNMVDLQSLISAFGTKQAGGTMCSLFNMYCDTYDLPSFLKTVLDTQHINNINQYLSDQGINYTF
jgi:hypothetical protein